MDLPYSFVTMVVRPLLIRVVERRRAGLLASVFDAQQEAYEQWVKQGRPAYPEKAQIEERLVAEGVL